ncbi:MAG: flippase [Chloroflexota bacterium]
MDKNFIARFLKGSISTSTGTIVTVVFHFLSITIMTRYVAPEALGLYFLVLATAMFFKILSNLGLDLTLVKFLSNEDESEKQETMTVILMTRFIVLTVLSLIVYFGGNLILPLLGEGMEPYVLFIPFIFVGHSVREMFLHLMQGLQQFKNHAILQVVSAIFKFALVFIYLEQLSLVALLNIELAMLGLSIIMQLWMVPFRQLGFFDLKFGNGTFKRVITFGFPLYYTSILTIGYDKSSVFLINFYLDPLSIALYEVALKIPDGFMRIFRSFITVYFPSISSLFAQKQEQEAIKVMNKSLGIFSLAITALCVGAFLFGREIVTLLFSDQYSSVYLAFAFMMIGVYLRVIANILGYSLVSANYPSTSSKVNTLSVIVYLVSSVLMIRSIGYIGAVFAFIIMNSSAIVSYYLYLRYYKIAPNMLTFIRPTVIGLLVGVVLWFMPPQTFLMKSAYFAVYVALSAFFVPEFKELAQLSITMMSKVSQRFGTATKPV